MPLHKIRPCQKHKNGKLRHLCGAICSVCQHTCRVHDQKTRECLLCKQEGIYKGPCTETEVKDHD